MGRNFSWIILLKPLKTEKLKAEEKRKIGRKKT
jgi:hypothetical protein